MLWFGQGELYSNECPMLPAFKACCSIPSTALFYSLSFFGYFMLFCNVMEWVSQEPWVSLDHKLVIPTTGVALDEISIC